MSRLILEEQRLGDADRNGRHGGMSCHSSLSEMKASLSQRLIGSGQALCAGVVHEISASPRSEGRPAEVKGDGLQVN